MSDEEESMSEGFSASEEEWKPTKEARGGESSDDDDSDFEESPVAVVTGVGAESGAGPGRKKSSEPKARSAAKQTISKKRPGLSLRAKLYNKYRPPPKTFSPPSSVGKNSPSASTSRTNPKNARAPNESSGRNEPNDDDEGSTSDGSIDNYLVNPDELDFQSSFFNVNNKVNSDKPSVSPVPNFDCNAGLGKLSDSDSDDGENNDSGNFHKEETKAFDFRDLLENANSLERAREAIAKKTAADVSNKRIGTPSKSLESRVDTMDVYSLLALGEKKNHRSHNEGEDEEDDDEEDEEGVNGATANKDRGRSKGPPKLNKTKSTRVKRHTKTRPASTVVADGDTDDSEFEEVADTSENSDITRETNVSHHGNLEIHVELPSRHREKKSKTQQDIENSLKRKLNREIKERQLLMHKVSFLCHFGRSYSYNRVLNNTTLMQKALTLLPSKNAYPPDRGTEIKYYQSLVTWYKSAITLKSQNLYPDKKIGKSSAKAHKHLLKQIEKKQAKSKQDLIFIFVILLRGMGLQCRLVVNMQPLPIKPPQTELLPIKLKSEEDETKKDSSKTSKESGDEPKTSSKSKSVKEKSKEIKIEKKKKEGDIKLDSKKVPKEATEKSNKAVGQPKQGKCKTVKNVQSSKQPSNKSKNSSEYNETITPEAKQNSNSVIEKKKTINEVSSSLPSRTQKTPIKATILDDSEPLAKLIKTNTKGNKTGQKAQTTNAAKSSATSSIEVPMQVEQQQYKENEIKLEDKLDNSQKENEKRPSSRPTLARLKRKKVMDDTEQESTKKHPTVEASTSIIPPIAIRDENEIKTNKGEVMEAIPRRDTRSRSRSKSPRAHISSEFLQTKKYKEKFSTIAPKDTNTKSNTVRAKTSLDKVKISADFLKKPGQPKRILRSRQKTNDGNAEVESKTDRNTNSQYLQIPQTDGAEDVEPKKFKALQRNRKKKIVKNESSIEESDEDFEPSPTKRPKLAPALAKKDRRVLSTDEEDIKVGSPEHEKRKLTACDMWVEVWSDVEEKWVCADLFKGKIHCVDTIRKSASSNLSYVFAFQNDLSIKDVTARYCSNWTNVVRKARIDKAWLDIAIQKYLGHRTKRDIEEDQDLRRIHEEKPMPTAISDYKNHPFYALERHLLKFEAIYPPNAPALGYIRKEAVYSRDCIHTLHSREIWLKQARVVKLGEKPYKIVKARPKWDRITQTVIKDQPLEIFGYWQTEDYDPPTAENGIVPRNAYGNVELFKPTMLPKKCVHLRLPGLNRICKKLGIDCANAVVGFDFHQGSCHPTYDGFVVCEEFGDQVTAAWYQDQEDQVRKEQEKYEARVYGNWKKLIRGLQIRERLKLKYNF